MYQYVCSLEADTMEQAFRLAQNDFNKEYAKIGVRSTSVGDIIQSEQDYDLGNCYLVKEKGFQCVPDTWLSFIDWGLIPLNMQDHRR